MAVYIYYHKFEKSMCSYDFTRRGLEQYILDNKMNVEIDSLTICEGLPHKKPYFKEFPQIYHNVSHSGDWWVCVYGTEENGLDLQRNENKKVDRIAKRFFHPREAEWLSSQETDQFFRVWAYNESYVKYKGDGLVEGLDYFSVVPEGAFGQELVLGVKDCCQQEIPFPDKDYWLVVTTEKKEKVIIRELEWKEHIF